MEKTLLIYTMENCPACQTMKSTLKRLRVEYTEIRLVNGMPVPPDVRSFPTLAIEKNGKRTTLCTGWPGSIEQLKKRLETTENSPLTFKSH
jgi:protein-disulfide isomerase-like protein with CxxC motif